MATEGIRYLIFFFRVAVSFSQSPKLARIILLLVDELLFLYRHVYTYNLCICKVILCSVCKEMASPATGRTGGWLVLVAACEFNC